MDKATKAGTASKSTGGDPFWEATDITDKESTWWEVGTNMVALMQSRGIQVNGSTPGWTGPTSAIRRTGLNNRFPSVIDEEVGNEQKQGH